MSRPYWLDDVGRPIDFGTPYSQHVRDYHFWIGLERMRSFRAELHRHQDAKAAKQCLSFGGCVAPCEHYRLEHLTRMDDLAALSQSSDRIMAEMRHGFSVAAPVTPPLSPMGGTHSPKLIKKAADSWAKNHAN
ncbi:MAG: hypothetical protein P1U47_13065 [Zhongshania sp.]|uniref:hypothetical protein n=1 Tax=Zhongshania sp. TaxID=1971902 RepID=UPI002623CACF|nr:hypothetical protein [Zhongshania sp.]MDF1693293.1 hypothetical protein [Zhongshania sp.]MDF1693304.1 hypothetical protein [Zhongshania sp.]